MARKILAREEGIELIEFVGLMPIVFILGLIVWQMMLFFHTQMITANAAREGARALSAYQYGGFECDDTWLPIDYNVGEMVEETRQGYQYRCNYEWLALQYGALAPCLPFQSWMAGDPAAVTVELRLPILQIPFVPIPEIWTRSTAVTMCEIPDDLFVCQFVDCGPLGSLFGD